jgi:hypothetical protein
MSRDGGSCVETPEVPDCASFYRSRVKPRQLSIQAVDLDAQTFLCLQSLLQKLDMACSAARPPTRRLERAERRPEGDDGDERQDRANDRHNDDIEVTFLVGAAAYGEQGHHGPIVGETVERSRADDRDPV